MNMSGERAPAPVLSAPVAERLRTAGLDPDAVTTIVINTLAEDLGGWPGVDVTTVATVPERQTDVADIVARAAGVVAGLAVAEAVFDLAGAGSTRMVTHHRDGERVVRDDVLATVTGPTRALLTAERGALNLLCRMSGVATHTRAWADALAGTGTTALDTRKTTPGLRLLEKYAVRVGGGTNKRMGLYDVAMVKDNHKLAAGGVAAAVDRVRGAFPDVPIQVEVTTVDEAQEAVAAGATFLLCDNMPLDLLRQVVTTVGEGVELEATGGLTLAVAAEVAATGVDYVSVGALTHSSPILDIAIDLRPRG
jgi:nicotinate-nucleotide pyrophosphorylase (carboxylating)